MRRQIAHPGGRSYRHLPSRRWAAMLRFRQPGCSMLTGGPRVDAVAGEALAPWRADVQARKMLFARGAGMVHGTFYSLVAQAILPR